MVDANTLLAGLRGARMPFDLTVTASIGACSGRPARESDRKAMYAAKHAGRDRCRAAIAA